MAINGSYSYTLYSKVLTVSHNSVDYEYGVTSCVINQDGSLGQCVDIPLINGNDENIANQPTSIAFYNNHVYITNSASQPDSYGGDIVICAVDNNTGALSECTTQSIENNSSYGISALNDFAFITGDDGSSNVKTCKIEGNGSLTECVTSPGIDIGSPLGISIFMPPS